MILTRHGVGITKNANGTVGICARIADLRRTAQDHMLGVQRRTAEERLNHALDVPCSCGAGDSDVERSSILKQEKLRAASAAESGETSTPEP